MESFDKYVLLHMSEFLMEHEKAALAQCSRYLHACLKPKHVRYSTSCIAYTVQMARFEHVVSDRKQALSVAITFDDVPIFHSLLCLLSRQFNHPVHRARRNPRKRWFVCDKRISSTSQIHRFLMRFCDTNKIPCDPHPPVHYKLASAGLLSLLLCSSAN